MKNMHIWECKTAITPNLVHQSKWRMTMRRITIRNLKSPKTVKPHLFNALIDCGEVYLEIKTSNKGNEVISLTDIMDQVTSSESMEAPCAEKEPQDTG